MRIHVGRKIEKIVSPEDLVKMLIKDRKLGNYDTFINPESPARIHLSDFFDETYFKKNWNVTIKKLDAIKKRKKMIVVYMDYDADGITGGAIVWQTLSALGFTVMPYIPDRVKEGYGFSEVGLNNVIKKHNPSLIISVDHGIVAHEQISYAKKRGIDVIVTDHHQRKKTDPADALAIFHTSQVSGSGVAYFFAKAIAQYFDKGIVNRFDGEFLALAAIGTVADMVPLIGPSRSLVKYGLHALRGLKAGNAPGLVELLRDAGVDQQQLQTYQIGYILAPRINAFGRIQDSMNALRLLCTKNKSQATKLAIEAGLVNKERQDLVELALEEAENLVKQEKVSEKIITVYSEDWTEGIMGLVAGRLAQMYHKPAIVMTKSFDHIKGSVRSIEGYDIMSLIRDPDVDELLQSAGGHPGAAGFSLKDGHLDDFISLVRQKTSDTLTDRMLEPSVYVDIQIPIELVTTQLAETLSLLEPFGMGNMNPTFLFKAIVKDVQRIGRNGRSGGHAKVMFASQSGTDLVEGIYFNGIDEMNSLESERITCIGSIQLDEWRGRKKAKLMIRMVKS